MASVQVDSADPWGISIVNGEFTSFSGGFGPDVADHTQVVVSPSNAGAVRFVSSAFWGPSHQIAKIAGKGSVGFESCLFNTWDAKKDGRAAVQVYGGDVMVRGCDFQSAHPGGQVLLAPGTGKAISEWSGGAPPLSPPLALRHSFFTPAAHPTPLSPSCAQHCDGAAELYGPWGQGFYNQGQCWRLSAPPRSHHLD